MKRRSKYSKAKFIAAIGAASHPQANSEYDAVARFSQLNVLLLECLSQRLFFVLVDVSLII